MHPFRRAALASSALLFLLASCSRPTPVPTQTPIPPLVIAVPSNTPAVVPATSTPVPAPQRAVYTLNAVMDYIAKTVEVDQTIVYPNHSGQPLTDMLLAVVPNYWAGGFTLSSLNVDGTAITGYTLDGQRLAFPLPRTFHPETTITITMQYSLVLPRIEPTDPGISRPRIYGYSPRQINLTNWYPFVVPRIQGEWVLHDPWAYGEHLVYDAADFVVTLRQSDPSLAPVIAASGAPAQNGDGTTYELTAGRTFAISASTEFLTKSAQAGQVTVTSYYLQPIYEAAATAALNTSAQAIEIFSQRFGPYPHATLAVVMGDFNDGMEFSALYFHSAGLYNLYDGSMSNLVVSVAAHETAHQWWFEQVGNDQALQPWLDEALCAYSEHVYYESASPASIDQWWWIYRVDAYNPQGWADTPIYAGGGFQPYTNAVYFRGAHFMDELRARLGDEAFFAFLQTYLGQQQGKIATAEGFFRLLREQTTVDFSDLERAYFQNVY